MASEKQIAANRANARKSTGPKTATGKLKSSRNAFRHGLSGPVPLDPATYAKVDSLAREVAGDQASDDQQTAAQDFARAQIELLRIGLVRAEQLGNTDISSCNVAELKRLAALDRYERYSRTKRRRAAQRLRFRW
jgi:hypothetical protein